MTSPFFFATIIAIFNLSFNSNVFGQTIFYTPKSKSVKNYYLVDRKVIARDAYNHCKERGWEFTVIKDEEEWNDVRDNLLKEYFSSQKPSVEVWLGYRSDPSTSNLTTWDRIPVDLPDQTFWMNSRLANKQNYDRCLYSQEVHHWNWFVQSCDDARLPFLCTGNYPSCHISDLDVPNADFASCLTNTLVKHGTNVTINCWDNHKPVGHPTAFCDKGHWIASTTCIPGCKEPEKRPHSKLISGNKEKFYNTGETATFVCHTGYMIGEKGLRNVFELQCQKDGMWSEPDKDCIIGNNFDLEVINIGLFAPVKLQCKLPNYSAKDIIQWIKNDELIPNGNQQYETSETGTLIAGHNSDEGIYYCISTNGEVQVGNTIYQLVRKECFEEKVIDQQAHFAEEKSSLLLSCNQSSTQNYYKWYKDGSALSPMANQIVLPNGALLIRNVRLADEGIYSCESLKDSCRVKVNHKVKVDASAESVCGDKTKEDTSPWLMTLWNSDEVVPFCYGTLIHKQWVITSAFCVASYRRKKNLALMVEIASSDGKQRRLPVESIKIHPMYRPRMNANDIGLLKLMVEVNFTNEVLPVCLLKFNVLQSHACSKSVDVNGIVAGWGSLEVQDVAEMFQLYENMSVVNRGHCQKDSVVGFTNDMFCCEAVSNTITDEFAGDSGSPFLITWRGRVHLMGIYSWGQRATGTGMYDYFTYTVNHYKWIKEILETF